MRRCGRRGPASIRFRRGKLRLRLTPERQGGCPAGVNTRTSVPSQCLRAIFEVLPVPPSVPSVGTCTSTAGSPLLGSCHLRLGLPRQRPALPHHPSPKFTAVFLTRVHAARTLEFFCHVAPSERHFRPRNNSRTVAPAARRRGYVAWMRAVNGRR